MVVKMYELLQGDCIEVMKTLEANSVQTCVTSPPYYGLRDYGHEGQIGLEETPDAYVAKLVDVFREVRRVLHPTGVIWVNLGDSYASSGPKSNNNGLGGSTLTTGTRMERRIEVERMKGKNLPNRLAEGCKPKDLIGIPWLVAFALRADGWWLRSDIIWHKPNPMPESVTDRPTKAHEYIFLLSKSAQYYYDADAVAEPAKPEHLSRYKYNFWGNGTKEGSGGGRPSGASNTGGHKAPLLTRNRRSVWTVTTKPYSGAHFATFPPDLIEPCILAGSSAHGCCADCGAPWARVTDIERAGQSLRNPEKLNELAVNGAIKGGTTNRRLGPNVRDKAVTLGWQPTCTCNADVVPCTVLDPFNGSGTTGAVSLKHGRNYIGIDLNPEYLELAHSRITQAQPMLAGIL